MRAVIQIHAVTEMPNDEMDYWRGLTPEQRKKKLALMPGEIAKTVSEEGVDVQDVSVVWEDCPECLDQGKPEGCDFCGKGAAE